MLLPRPLLPGKLIKRYKRFLADIKLETGEIITAHCPNTGSMKKCAEPGWKTLVSQNKNPKRKLAYTWELVHNTKCWIGINTYRANKLVVEALQENKIPKLAGYKTMQTEVRYGKNSRIDILLRKRSDLCYVEIKSVTLIDDGGYYTFPDTVTVRGTKHLTELVSMKKQSHRAVMFFILQRSDGRVFRPAEDIDRKYAETLRAAYKKGVEILVYGTKITKKSIKVTDKIDFVLG